MKKIWQILYPILLYYATSSIVFFVLQFFIGTDDSSYMLRQMICSLFTIPVTYNFYRLDKMTEDNIYGELSKKKDILWCKMLLYSIIAVVCIGMATNNFLAMTPLLQMSEGFQEANQAFFAGGVWVEILASGLLIPIAEELLFRGVVFKRLRVYVGEWPAIILSAVIFGAFHVNTVQFIYATILGLILAFIVMKTRRVSMAIFGHMAVNLVAILRTETGWFDFSYEPTVAGIVFSLIILGAGAVTMWRFKRLNCE